MKSSSYAAAAAAALVSLASLATGQQFVYSIASDDAIKAGAKQAAQDMLRYYHGTEPGQVPGILPGPPPAGPYYWWIGGDAVPGRREQGLHAQQLHGVDGQ
ncbi:hypothetical protein NQ176_g11019 [Zarea fungicola]|uniref:Uncharacterized protein n=1 Tax=Zarea fungicola TaxID=93591 RepID=A0ACC1MDB6_9HYPO|nr:hypothetical protein NQ176_g11019 [Lecanicillium fungicola]